MLSITISRFSSLNFEHKWRLGFQTPVVYEQRFRIGDTVRVQYSVPKADPFRIVPQLVDRNTGVVTELTPLLIPLANNDTYNVADVSFVTEETGLFTFQIVQGTTPEHIAAYSDFCVEDDLTDTVLFGYENRRDEFDVFFCGRPFYIGNLVSASKLVGMFGIKAPSTFLEYFSYLKDSYLLEFVPQFSHSLKAQARNPKKVYVMDMGLYTENSISTSENQGRRLENLIFLHLRRISKNIFYFKGRSECDFVVMEKNKVTRLVQVCTQITDENFNREYNGLKEAMDALELTEGTIVTMDQTDRFEQDEKIVRVIPAHEYLTKL